MENENKKNKCVILNSNTINLKIINSFLKKDYKIFCINNNSIYFCLNNKIKFSYFDNFLNLNEKKNFCLFLRQIWKKIFLQNQKKGIILKLISYDYYSLHYFFLSLYQGRYIAKKKYFKNLKNIVYIGEDFSNIKYFNYNSKLQNTVLLKEFFDNLDIKPKLFLEKKKINFLKKIQDYLKKIITIILSPVFSLFSFVKIRLSKKKRILFLNHHEIFRNQNFKKDFLIHNSNPDNYNLKLKFKFLFDKEIIIKNFFTKKNLKKNQKKEMDQLIHQFYKNIKKEDKFLKKYQNFFDKYFFERIAKIYNHYHNLKSLFYHYKIKDIAVSNLWDLESFLPVLVFDNLKKNYLIPHSNIYPTINFNEKSVLILNDKFEKKFHPKKIRFIRNKNKFILDEYQATNFNFKKNYEKKTKDILFLSQSLTPDIESVSFFSQKSFFFSNIHHLNKIKNSKFKAYNFYIKLHPAMMDHELINFLKSEYTNLIFIGSNVNYKHLSIRFQKFFLFEFPVKIGISLIKDKKKVYFFKYNDHEIHTSTNKNFKKIFKNYKNLKYLKNISKLEKVLR